MRLHGFKLFIDSPSGGADQDEEDGEKEEEAVGEAEFSKFEEAAANMTIETSTVSSAGNGNGRSPMTAAKNNANVGGGQH